MRLEREWYQLITKQCKNSVLKAFHAWAMEQKKSVSSDHMPSDILTCHNAAVVCKYMRQFVLEDQNEDGKPRNDLKPQQQTEQSHEKNAAPFSVLDKGNPKFNELLLISLKQCHQ